jgi:hypothetical protein
MNTKDKAISGNVSTERALDLALEALEETLKTLDDANANPGGPIADTIWYSSHETLFDYLEAQITAIKQARSAPYVASPRVQEPVAWRWKNNGEDKWLNEYTYLDRGGPDCPEECEPLYTTPPTAPVQEPVGVFREDDDIGHVDLMPHQQMKLKDGDLVYAAPPKAPVQSAERGEPVAWIFKPNRELLWPNEVERKNPLELNEYAPLYTTPPGGRQSEDCLTAAPVPDALTDQDPETPEYREGWNDCRAFMLNWGNNP